MFEKIFPEKHPENYIRNLASFFYSFNKGQFYMPI